MIQAVIFDLDGVLVTTDECHFQAWKAMADEAGIPFTRKDNERLRGVSRMESLEIILEKAQRDYTPEEKRDLAACKNTLYVQLIGDLTTDAILPGAIETLYRLKTAGIRLAVGSSSKNAPVILERLDLNKWFEAIADGNQIKQSKPAPDVFLLAAKLLGVSPEKCLVVEDADAGVDAALAANMTVLAVGAAKNNPKANLRAESLADINLIKFLNTHTKLKH